MSRLVFEVADVRRVVEHTLKAKDHRPHVINYTDDSEPITEPGKPAVLLVHDDGVYLMSNGLPHDPRENSKKFPRSFVAYARGCNPKDPDVWEHSRALVGGDDFAETLPWAEEMKRMIDSGATAIVVEFSEKELVLNCVHDRRKK